MCMFHLWYCFIHYVFIIILICSNLCCSKNGTVKSVLDSCICLGSDHCYTTFAFIEWPGNWKNNLFSWVEELWMMWRIYLNVFLFERSASWHWKKSFMSHSSWIRIFQSKNIQYCPTQGLKCTLRWCYLHDYRCIGKWFCRYKGR